MCEECFQKYGAPQIDNRKVRIAAGLIREVYEHHCCGGGLHIVVDDWNLETHHIEWCMEEIKKYHYDDPDHPYIETLCAQALLPLTEAERASALHLAEEGGM